MKKRIWELDALRGICILGMLVVHILFDLILFDLWQPGKQIGGIYRFLTQWGGILFLLLSGICVTLGSHPIRRGAVVLASGFLCTLVTWGGYRLDMMDKGIVIYFGVLHCLGICMLLWPLFKKLPLWALAVLAIAMIALGYGIESYRVKGMWLVWLGLLPQGFVSGDYFPLLPNLGYFLLGAMGGLTLYRNKTSLLPRISGQNAVLRFFRACGRYSLHIYLLHQPVIYGLIYAYAEVFT